MVYVIWWVNKCFHFLISLIACTCQNWHFHLCLLFHLTYIWIVQGMIHVCICMKYNMYKLLLVITVQVSLCYTLDFICVWNFICIWNCSYIWNFARIWLKFAYLHITLKGWCNRLAKYSKITCIICYMN